MYVFSYKHLIKRKCWSGQRSESSFASEHLWWTRTHSKRWTTIDSRWKRKKVFRHRSADASVRCRLRPRTKETLSIVIINTRKDCIWLHAIWFLLYLDATINTMSSILWFPALQEYEIWNVKFLANGCQMLTTSLSLSHTSSSAISNSASF